VVFPDSSRGRTGHSSRCLIMRVSTRSLPPNPPTTHLPPWQQKPSVVAALNWRRRVAQALRKSVDCHTQTNAHRTRGEPTRCALVLSTRIQRLHCMFTFNRLISRFIAAALLFLRPVWPVLNLYALRLPLTLLTPPRDLLPCLKKPPVYSVAPVMVPPVSSFANRKRRAL